MHLNSIVLNNIRRFGGNVEIKMGAGATILLAPNGTGKTSVFEGVELALTGGVRRLNGNISTLVGEDKEQASALLNFNEAVSKVVVDKNGKVHHEINELEKLLQGTSQEQLPYLFRLTHLLDQREGGWFVQANETEAGKILGSVPIGKDANRVGDGLTSTTRGFSSILKDEKERLVGVINKRDTWNDLIKVKNETLSGLSESLEPLDEIYRSIFEIESNLVKENNIEIISISTAVASCAALRIILDGEVEKVSSLKVALGIAPTYIEQFKRLKKQHAIFSMETEKLKVSKSEKYENIEICKAVLTKEKNSHQVQKGIVANVSNVLSKLKELDEIRKSLDIKVEECVGIGVKVEDLNSNYLKQKNRLNKLNDIISSLRMLGEREVLLKNKENEITESRIQIKNWKTLDQSLRTYNEEETKLEEKLSVAERKLSGANTELAKSDRDVSQLQRVYDGLNTVSGLVSEAVGVIADNLSKNSENCPVCNEFHGAGELQRRIAHSVASIDPELAEVKNRLGSLKETNISAKEISISLSEAKNELQTELSDLQASKEKCNQEIAFLRSKNRFLYLGDIPFVESYLDEESKTVSLSREKFVKEIALAESMPSDEEILEAHEAVKHAENELSEAKQFEVKINSERNDLKGSLELVKASVDTELSIEDAILNLSSEEINLANAANKLVEVETLIKNLKEEYVIASEVLSEEELKLQSNIESTEKCAAKWQSIPLAGNPSEEILETAVSQTENDIKSFNAIEVQLTKIRSQLASWESSESLEGVIKQIDEVRGDLSEVDHTARLEKDVWIHQRLVEDIQIKESTYKVFSGHLKKELEGVKEQVNSIKPEWRALLNRIVRDERISQAGLSYKQKYQKGKASVTLPINGKDTIASLVGSEAQMTDMQLSFLLTMAAKHPWCNWKGLLLDDPTQHHDMVHASAVFDVLRDYIVDRGFQVLLATHDAQQARFFMRKLENDGIESRIMVLEPGSDGVRCNQLR